MSTVATPSWAELLQRAVSEPGAVSTAYSRFHNYSLGNQVLALVQCQARGIELGPIASFMRWKELGRHVMKGEKAIELCMPVAAKRTETITDDDGNESETEHSYTRFIYRRNWFALSQTEGAEYTPEPIPGWDETRAVAVLNIERVPFAEINGNVQGYARKRTVAVSSLAALPHKTLLHELAHVILGHTAEAALADGDERTPRDIRELEAECVALLCCESLGLPGADFSRGYIQWWFHGQVVPERNAQRIFKAADEILKAGEVRQ